MAAKISIAITGYQIAKNSEQEKVDLVSGIGHLITGLYKSVNKSINITLIHGCSSAFDLWVGAAAMELGLGLELYLPFPRITMIAKHRLSPLQAENLNYQIVYSDKVNITSKTYHYHAYMKRTESMVNRCFMAATYNNKNIKDLYKYCWIKDKKIIDLKKFCDMTETNNIHIMGELL